MKLSFIFELLLIFILIAFAASAVIDSKALHNSKRAITRKHGKITHKRRQDSSSNKYCSCSTKICNCCREFNIPVVSLQGPGCASLQYLKGDRLAISMSFGERVLTNTTISSKKPRPVCMPLPGGVSKFCGRVYNIGRKGDDFKACLGLELRALNDVEAALRVSCFRFGPNGLRVEPSQPLPVVEEEDNDEDDDDDDDDDDEDDYDFDDDDDDDDNEIDSVDYGTFSVFDDDFIGEYFQSESSGSKKKKVQTTKAPVRKVTRKPVITPAKTNRKPLRTVRPKPVSVRPPVKSSTSSTPAKLQVTQVSPVMNEVTSNPFDMQTSGEKVPSSSHESIAAVTAMLQGPAGEAMSQAAAEVPASPASIDTPAPTATQTTQQMPDMSTNVLTEQPGSMSQGTGLKDITEESINQNLETTTLENTDSTTTLPDNTTKAINKKDKNDESDEDDDDDDPISEVVGEVIEEEVDSAETTTKEAIQNDKDIAKPLTTKHDSKDVVDDIVDGMVDTFAEDDSESEETSTNKTNSEASDDDDDDDAEEDDEDEEEEDYEDDDDEEEEDEEEEARKARREKVKKARGRQSRDMWLARLHW
ncbi:uncharacterized protein LOC659126 [Tribolium castaneum]|uniref:DUF4773 domain-containing protein n=1 Tax=Tribolium castaneum TaxID=7070 RepID=D6W7K2_TRICA|nr:PREDICTED: nuclear polyadenylated RNA-binding protein 3 [Tribolium castaneum]XP_970551.1 PREDICTED: nuclear polyadenylated RNA-binding protein 3 [Tribolium castaneum]EFA11303.1 hypothetical protein TcasGA2_TC010840 [Tribolium castaneum]|eukprot:XP_015836824.1 PREDICTED: nuclear polyadenylated RNA-binding protein 3 [Tribolium castaneum]